MLLRLAHTRLRLSQRELEACSRRLERTRRARRGERLLGRPFGCVQQLVVRLQPFEARAVVRVGRLFSERHGRSDQLRPAELDDLHVELRCRALELALQLRLAPRLRLLDDLRELGRMARLERLARLVKGRLGFERLVCYQSLHLRTRGVRDESCFEARLGREARRSERFTPGRRLGHHALRIVRVEAHELLCRGVLAERTGVPSHLELRHVLLLKGERVGRLRFELGVVGLEPLHRLPGTGGFQELTKYVERTPFVAGAVGVIEGAFIVETPRVLNGMPLAAGIGTTVSITNVALTSNVATITTAVAHGLGVGQVVAVAAVTATTVNSTAATITAVTSTTFTYAKTASNVTSAADTGTVTFTNNYRAIIAGREALAEAQAADISTVIGPEIDALRRFRTIGWYYFGGFNRLRESALFRIESAATNG